MKFLFDQSADFRLIPHLREQAMTLRSSLATILLALPMRMS